MRVGMSWLVDAEFGLHGFEWDAFGFGDHELHPEEVEEHHESEEEEDIAGREGGDHFGERGGEDGGEDPMSETAESLAVGAMAVRKDFGNENPNDCALADGVS